MKSTQLKILLSLFILFLFITIEAYSSYVVWIFFFFCGEAISKKINPTNYTKHLFAIFYLIFSLIGLIICIDNYYNFNSLFGFAGDDLKFFESTMYLINEGPKPTIEISLFSYFLVPIAYPISLFKEVSLCDLLPFNWFLAGIIGLLINKLYHSLCNRNIPIILLVLSYSFNFTIMDSFTRLYRDNLLILFTLLAVLSLVKKDYKSTLLFIIPVILLRFANITLVFIYWVAQKFQIKKKRFVFISLITCTLVIISFLPNLVRFAMIYGSDASRIGRYESAFSKLDSDEAFEARFKENQGTKNSLMAQAYSETSAYSIAIRAIFSYFYPLAFSSPNTIAYHSKLGQIRGFYLYNCVKWVSTLCLVVLFPLMVVGILYNQNIRINQLIITQLIFLTLVLLISGQIRHTIGVYIFNAIIITNGFELIRKKRSAKVLFYSLSVICFAAISIYNLIG